MKKRVFGIIIAVLFVGTFVASTARAETATAKVPTFIKFFQTIFTPADDSDDGYDGSGDNSDDGYDGGNEATDDYYDGNEATDSGEAGNDDNDVIVVDPDDEDDAMQVVMSIPKAKPLSVRVRRKSCEVRLGTKRYEDKYGWEETMNAVALPRYIQVPAACDVFLTAAKAGKYVGVAGYEKSGKLFVTEVSINFDMLAGISVDDGDTEEEYSDPTDINRDLDIIKVEDKD